MSIDISAGKYFLLHDEPFVFSIRFVFKLTQFDVIYCCLEKRRLEHLKADGFHIRPQYDGVIDKTYACAILGLNVPFPTPVDQFVPTQIRRRWEQEWPRLEARAKFGQDGWR